MSSNPNNKGKGGGQGPRKRGFIFGAILWALVLVIFFNFLAKQIANAGTKEVPYSEFIQMVEEDKVATVELTSNKYTFYLKEDLPAGAGEGGSQDLAEVLAQQMEQGGATRYVTAPVVARAHEIQARLEVSDINQETISQNILEKKKKENRQTDLFHLPQDDLIDELKNLDVLSITPMDALNTLFRLREKARRL